LAHRTALVKIKPQREVIMTGHSLGGSVAQVVGAKEALPAITYNAPGIVYSRRYLPPTPPPRVPTLFFRPHEPVCMHPSALVFTSCFALYRKQQVRSSVRRYPAVDGHHSVRPGLAAG
jgi:hypothetical protein